MMRPLRTVHLSMHRSFCVVFRIVLVLPRDETPVTETSQCLVVRKQTLCFFYLPCLYSAVIPVRIRILTPSLLLCKKCANFIYYFKKLPGKFYLEFE